MRYVVLLRGINVGGRNKVDMKQLVVAMDAVGFEAVSAYINRRTDNPAGRQVREADTR